MFVFFFLWERVHAFTEFSLRSVTGGKKRHPAVATLAAPCQGLVLVSPVTCQAVTLCRTGLTCEPSNPGLPELNFLG